MMMMMTMTMKQKMIEKIYLTLADLCSFLMLALHSLHRLDCGLEVDCYIQNYLNYLKMDTKLESQPPYCLEKDKFR